MMTRWLLALTAVMVAATATPLTNIRDALFCNNWSPMGTSSIAEKSPYEYYCSHSRDRRSLTMRVIASDPEDSFMYLMMAPVDSSGDALIGGTYEIEKTNPLRTVTCDDKSRRVVKRDERKSRDTFITYYLPEDKRVTLKGVSCRFVVATSLTQYYEDVIINRFGKEVLPQNETDSELQNEQQLFEAQMGITPDIEISVVDTTNQTKNNTAVEKTSSQTTQENFEEELDLTNDQDTVEKQVKENLDNFEPNNIIDDADDMRRKFENDEMLGKETEDTEKGSTQLAAAPDVQEDTEKLQNEGQDKVFKSQFVTDRWGIGRELLRENTKKLIYKGQATGYWCEAFGNTYVLAPGTGCQMFHQTIVTDDSSEFKPLSTTSCSPGTIFSTNPGACTCVSYRTVMCPEPKPEQKSSKSKSETSPVIGKPEAEVNLNQTATLESSLVSLNETVSQS